MKKNKIVIVGAGFTGAYIARNLAEQDWDVRLVEKRNHIAGHMYDKIDESTGCLVHEYGPHIFHTNDDDIWKWLNSFAEFEPFELKTQVFFESYKEWFTCSFGFHTIEQLFDDVKAKEIIKALKKEYPNQETVTVYELINSKNEDIKEFANILWEEDYKPYTAKQWGLQPDEVDINIFKRVPIYLSYYNRYNKDKYEGLPVNGYTALFANILDHENIKIDLNTNALENIEIIDGQVYYENEPTILVYSGAIDELFQYKYGDLGYRSLKFEKEITKNNKNSEFGTPCVDVYPNHKYPYTRISNYGLLPIQNHLDLQISVKEYSYKFKVGRDIDRYYPILTNEDKIKLEKYKKDAEEVKGLYLSGRLADYKYYDMDKSLIAARDTLEIILDNE